MRILLVEDSPADRELVRHGFRERGSEVVFDVACTGLAGLEHLRRATRGEAPVPDLVVLDVNLPELTGPEVLGAVREERLVPGVPVAFFSTSDAPEDRAAGERLGADAYFLKPDGLEQLLDVLERMEALARRRA